MMFQSAPRAAREANELLLEGQVVTWPFQSAPRAAREANPAPGIKTGLRDLVSIRASRCARGEQERGSTLSARARVSIRASRCARGEPRSQRAAQPRLFVSIRASRCARGELPISSA